MVKLGLGDGTEEKDENKESKLRSISSCSSCSKVTSGTCIGVEGGEGRLGGTQMTDLGILNFFNLGCSGLLLSVRVSLSFLAKFSPIPIGTFLLTP